MRELRVRVEQAVRPVRASQHRKSAMRDELLSHLTAVYEEEVVRAGDDPARALDEALARFGDAAELTTALQETVPRWERIFWWQIPGLGCLDVTARLTVLRCAPGETVEHCVARQLGLAMLLATALVVVPISVVYWVRVLQNSDYPALAELELLLGSSMLGVAAVATLLFSGAAAGLSNVLRGERAARRAGLVFWGALSLTLFVTGLVFLSVMRWNGLFATWHVWVLAGCSLAVPCALAALLRAMIDEARRYVEWDGLDLAC